MANEMNYEQYERFKERRKELAEMLEGSAGVIAALGMDKYRENLRQLSEKVHNDTFKVLVAGTFKNGKSTFINSLLGEEILPAYALPCTAVINEVKWGERQRAVVHFRDPLPEQIPSGIPEKTLAYMKEHGMKSIPPLEIPYDEIEDYVVIPFDKDPKEMLLESPYEKVELFWPLDLLKSGVEIIDSPGLNEHRTRTKVTMDYLSKADAILVVLNAQAICSQEEMSFIENSLSSQGFTDPFFIVNRFDCIRSGNEKEAMKKYAAAKLKGYTSNDIYFISALNALDGKLNDSDEQYAASGMKEFEDVLSDFLTRQKGKAKLSQPARELKRILNEEALFKIIPMQRKMLGTSLNELKHKYDTVKPKLSELKLKKERVYSRMMLKIEQAKPEIKHSAYMFYKKITEKIPGWVADFSPRTEVGVIPTKEKVAQTVAEITEYVSDMIEIEHIEWRRKVLEPYLSAKAKDIFESVETDIGAIFTGVDNVTFEMSGTTSYDNSQQPVWQRLVNVAGGVVTGNLGITLAGSVKGVSPKIVTTLVIEMGSYMALALLNMLNPATMVGILVGSIAFNLGTNISHTNRVIKEKVTEQTISMTLANAERNAEITAASSAEKFAGIAENVAGAVDSEISETDMHIRQIIDDLQRGNESVLARERVIADCEERIKRISAHLDDLIFRLVEE